MWTFTAHRRRSTDLHNDISDPPPPRTPCILLRVACVRRGGRRCPVVLPPSAAITSGGGARRPPVEFSHVSPSWAAAVRSRVSRVHSSGVLIRAPAALPHAIPRPQCVDRSNIRCSPHRLYNIIKYLIRAPRRSRVVFLFIIIIVVWFVEPIIEGCFSIFFSFSI